MSLFYNTVTEAVVDYSGLKALFPTGFSWPTNDTGLSVDARLLMDNIHPDIIQWKRLFEIAPPGVKLWEILDGYDVVYNSLLSRYEQEWNFRSRDVSEMHETNLEVQNFLEDLKYQKLLEPIEYNDLVANALAETQVALSRVISAIMSNISIDEIAWEGGPNENNINQWKVTTVPDLQELSSLCFLKEQSAYFAKKYVMEQQLISSYDYFSDVQTAFNEQMEAS